VKLSSQSAAPKVLWIRRNDPDTWQRTCKIVNGSGYLNLKLTGESTIDRYDAAAFSPFFDLNTLEWNPQLAAAVAPLAWMPRPTWTCEIAGRVTPRAADETGLASGTPVITGTADAAAEAISAGMAHSGDLMIMYGSSSFFILKTDRSISSPGFWSGPFLESGTYAVAGGTSTAGSLTRWFRDQFSPTELEEQMAGGENAFTALARLAELSPPGANGLIALPYFYGERTPLNDPKACGMIFGLTLSHTRADFYRALLEGVGYSVRHNLETMQALGLHPLRLLAVGGGAQNRPWMQMVSDIAGITQIIPAQNPGPVETAQVMGMLSWRVWEPDCFLALVKFRSGRPLKIFSIRMLRGTHSIPNIIPFTANYTRIMCHPCTGWQTCGLDLRYPSGKAKNAKD
jgi:xylulokinase